MQVPRKHSMTREDMLTILIVKVVILLKKSKWEKNKQTKKHNSVLEF